MARATAPVQSTRSATAYSCVALRLRLRVPQPQVSWWRSDYLPVVLSRSDESQQDFKWYNPQDPKEERQVLRHRQAITERFMSKVRGELCGRAKRREAAPQACTRLHAPHALAMRTARGCAGGPGQPQAHPDGKPAHRHVAPGGKVSDSGSACYPPQP